MSKKYYIYKITNILNKKVYIGQSADPMARWYRHRYLAKNKKTNQYVHHAINKHGVKNFTFEILEEHIFKNDCDLAEARVIRQYKSQDKKFGYNLRPGGNTRGGWKHSEETKKKMSEDWHKHHTLESIKKAHEANRGRKLSEEHKRKISEHHKENLHAGNYKKGYQPTQDELDKRKITFDKNYGSKVCNAPGCERTDGFKVNGIRYCDMHEQRLRKHGALTAPDRIAHNKGVPLPEETKAKISAALKGRKACQ